MRRLRERILHPLLVVVYFLVGVALSVLVVGGAMGVPPVDVFEARFAGTFQESIVFLLLLFGGLVLGGAVPYIVGLDPFRADRPWFLVWLNWFPPAAFLGAVFLAFNVGASRSPSAPSVAIAAAISLLLPLVAIGGEVALAGVLLALGRRFDEREWPGPAFFCLKASLRWRPGVRETARRCGLLLMEAGRYKAALRLIERVEPIGTSTDIEVLRALERAYVAEGRPDLALDALRRQQAVKPTRGLDERILEQCLQAERWDAAAEVLESGRLDMNLPRLETLLDVHAKRGDLDKACEVLRRIAREDPPPKSRAVRLTERLLELRPNDARLREDRALLLLDSGNADRAERGADLLETFLRENLDRDDLRRRLADFYRAHLHHPDAARQFGILIDRAAEFPPTPAEAELHLARAEALRDSGKSADAAAAYSRMRERFPDDWRPAFAEAQLRFREERFEEAAALLDAISPASLPEGSRLEVNILRNKIRARIEGRRLESLTGDLEKSGDDVARRLELVRELMDLGRVDQAIAECDRLLEDRDELLPDVQRTLEESLREGEGQFRARDFLADLHFRAGRYDEALTVRRELALLSLHPEAVLMEGCRKILSRAPGHREARTALAETAAAIGDWRTAADAYRILMESAPEDETIAARRTWIEAAYRAGDLAPALEAALEILDPLEEDAAFQALVVHMLEESEEYQHAARIFDRAHARFPDDDRFAAMRHRVEENRRRDRLHTLEELAAADKLNPGEHYEKAELHRGYGQTREAIVHYQRAADDPELHVVATFKLAVCLCDRRLFTLADETLDPIELTKERVQKHPELKNMLYWIADTLEVELYKDPAQKYFKRLFRVDASFKDVVTRLERLGAA